MSWESNRDKGWVRHPLKKRNIRRRLVDAELGSERLDLLLEEALRDDDHTTQRETSKQEG